jgi:hypothetical protein
VALPARPALSILAAAVATFDWSLGLNGLSYPWLSALSPYKSIRVVSSIAALRAGR